MKLIVAATQHWSHFNAKNHQRFEAVTASGIRVYLYVSRVPVVDPDEQAAFDAERAAVMLRSNNSNTEPKKEAATVVKRSRSLLSRMLFHLQSLFGSQR